jgi:nicotinamidase/pyrazinamidase
MVTRRLVLTSLGATTVAAPVPGTLRAAPIKPDEASALIVIDVQNCFLPGGSLARSKTANRSFPSSIASPRALPMW